MRRPALSIEPRTPIRHGLRPTVERGPTELQQLQKRTSHEKLLEAGRTAFAELSYAGTTIDHIVSRAAVNRSTFYRHFDSKFALAQDLFSHFWPKLYAEYDRLTSADPSETEIEDWVTHLLAFYRANKPLYITLGQIPLLERGGAEWEERIRQELITRLGSRIPAFRRASSTPELRIRVRMWMIQFEHGVFQLAYGPVTEDTAALLRFTVSEMRRFIVEEAG
ncbi:MAG TPA: TetR/AcrR family transcriptional regulator [Alphaproteobacteria bacterium]|nr:TetR/AcrR family transcriptional regulator [Alphaproteobacteria bacterium]